MNLLRIQNISRLLYQAHQLVNDGIMQKDIISPEDQKTLLTYAQTAADNAAHEIGLLIQYREYEGEAKPQ